MSTFILCPSCGEDLGCLSPAFQELQKYHNEKCLKQNTQIDPSCVELKPEIIKPVGYILDTLGLKKRCCRTHMISYVDFDNIYKLY
jgi:DNA-directed RNA polymerase subunit N (RpoN/RPB10)